MNCGTSALISAAGDTWDTAARSGSVISLASAVATTLVESTPSVSACLFAYFDAASIPQAARSIALKKAFFVLSAYEAAVLLYKEGEFVLDYANAAFVSPMSVTVCRQEDGTYSGELDGLMCEPIAPSLINAFVTPTLGGIPCDTSTHNMHYEVTTEWKDPNGLGAGSVLVAEWNDAFARTDQWKFEIVSTETSGSINYGVCDNLGNNTSWKLQLTDEAGLLSNIIYINSPEKTKGAISSSKKLASPKLQKLN